MILFMIQAAVFRNGCILPKLIVFTLLHLIPIRAEESELKFKNLPKNYVLTVMMSEPAS